MHEIDGCVYISISYMFSIHCVHCACVCSLHADTWYEDVRQRWFSAMMNVEGNRRHHASIAPDSNSLICLQLILIELNSSIACAHLSVRIQNRSTIVSKAAKRRRLSERSRFTVHTKYDDFWDVCHQSADGWHVRNDDANILSVLFVFDRHPVSSPSAFGGIQIVSRTCADGIYWTGTSILHQRIIIHFDMTQLAVTMALYRLYRPWRVHRFNGVVCSASELWRWVAKYQKLNLALHFL